MLAAVDGVVGSPGGRPASLPSRYAIPRWALPTTDSPICARDAGSAIGFEKRFAVE